MADHRIALAELQSVLDAINQADVERACARIARAGKMVLYGCGREGLQMRGLAMRLYHLGLNATMVGDMSTPPLGPGDLFLVSAGPGELSTVSALIKVARRHGAEVLFLTATIDAQAANLADQVLLIPAQTMANDQETTVRSVLPMGSVYEGTLFVLFEMLVLRLRDQLGATPEQMRARHTNME